MSLNRSQIMARIRGRDTRPEMVVRRALHAAGIRYRLHAPELAGRPDVVLRGWRTAIFVHGCFWHRHEGCRKCSTPKSNVDFWNDKFRANVSRDRRVHDALSASGWKVITIWECETASPERLASLIDRVIAIREVSPWKRSSRLSRAPARTRRSPGPSR